MLIRWRSRRQTPALCRGLLHSGNALLTPARPASPPRSADTLGAMDGSPAQAPRAEPRGRGVIEVVATVVVTLVLVGILGALLGRPARAGQSMEPLIPEKARVWLAAPTSFDRGDIVVILPDRRWHEVVVDEPGGITRALRWLRLSQPPPNSRLMVRIIGVPGDEVRCCGPDGHPLVNGHPVPAVLPESQFRVVVPQGRYFVASDAPSAAHSACYLSSLGIEALVAPERIVAEVDRVGWPWKPTDLAPSKASYAGIPGQQAGPEPIIEAGKDPSC